MNKKAQGMTTEQSGYAILGVFVLVIVLGGFIYFMFFGPGYFYKLFPTGFGNKTIVVNDIERLRYDIINDKVEYYDGKDWNDFSKQKEIQLGNKKVDYENAYQSFISIFDYGALAKKKIEMDSKGSYVELENPSGIHYLKKPGQVIMDLYINNPGGNPYLGFYILNMNNGPLSFFPGVPRENTILGKISKISNYITSWGNVEKSEFKDMRTAEIRKSEDALKLQVIKLRDALLKKSINIKYTDAKDKSENPAIVCATPRFNRYIDVDLREEVSENDECKQN